MSKEIEMKQHILKMIEDLMMGNSGGKFKPKAIAIDVMAMKPKESLVEEEEEDKLPEGQEDMDEDEEMGEGYHDEEEEEETKGNKPKMSLKDFLASR